MRALCKGLIARASYERARKKATLKKQIIVRNPLLILGIFLLLSLACSTGLIKVNLTTDPVELWSSAGSDARENRDFFGRTFRSVDFSSQISTFAHLNVSAFADLIIAYNK